MAIPPPDSDDERQRQQIREALLTVVAERGYSEAVMEPLLAEAGVDAAGFARCYPSLDACFDELWEECKDTLVARTSTAFLACESWRDGMRAAAWTFCRWLQENPDRSRILLVDLSFADEMVRASFDQVFAAYAELIHLGAKERAGPPIAREHADAIMGAIWQRVATAVHAGAFDSMPRFVPELMYTTVLPYFGAEAAREELRRGPADIARYERGEL